MIDDMREGLSGKLEFGFEPPTIVWTAAGKTPVAFECSHDNDPSKPKATAALQLLGGSAKRDHRSFSFLLRHALARAVQENEGWVTHAPAELERLRGWASLKPGSRTNTATELSDSLILEWERVQSGRGAKLRRSRLKAAIDVSNLDAEAARRWLGPTIPSELPDMNAGLAWAEMARLALATSDVLMPYLDAAIVLCANPGYRGWSSEDVRIRVDGMLDESLRLQPSRAIFPEAEHGGSRTRYSLHSLPSNPLMDDASIQEFGLLRSDHAAFVRAGLMLKHACFDATGGFVGRGGTLSGRTVMRAFPLGSSGATYNVDAEVILETSDGQVVFARRPGRGRYANDTWSASIEEQLDETDDFLKAEYDRANPIFNCAIRGIVDELRVAPHEIADLRLMSVFLGALVYSGSFLFCGKLTIPFRELRFRVPEADDRREHAAVAASPCTEATIQQLLATDTYEPPRGMLERIDPSPLVPRAAWHPNSKLRMYTHGRWRGWRGLPVPPMFSGHLPEAAALRGVR